MYNTADQLLKRIDTAKVHIRSLFVQQCIHGCQTKTLNDPQAAACGQFLKELNRPQRGVHGTAAAIRVLAGDERPEPTAVVGRLLKYVENRTHFEAGKCTKCKRDDQNVVKLSETIIAMKRVGAAASFVRQLVIRLESGIKEGRGWSWFLDDTDAPEPYPTACAYYALSRIGSTLNLQPTRDYLLSNLREQSQRKGVPQEQADVVTDVFCLYALAHTASDHVTDIERRLQKDAFDRIWHCLKALISDDLEQNIEYWDGADTCYVRIPWQLYLLALASQYRFHRHFSSLRAQSKLDNILTSVKDDTLLYPYSGKFLSSRTYAILYETLGMIHRNLEHQQIFRIRLLWDHACQIFRTRTARVIVGILVTMIVIYVGIRWYRIRAQADYAAIFGNIIAAWILTALSWTQRNR